jgi:hypothetical protein
VADIRLTASITWKLRTNLSYQHIRGAALNAGRCAPLERSYEWPATEGILLEHTTAAASAVILAACSLEAHINEWHLDAVDGNTNALGRAAEAAPMIAKLWDTVERQPLLRKYQWYLEVSRCQSLDRGGSAYQAVADLIEIRDYLVHYKPEWSDNPRQNKRLEDRLRGKFPLNRLSKPDQFFIPYRGLGHGCGVWAVQSVVSFVREFSDLLGVPSRLDRLEPELAELLRADAA